MRFNWWLIAWVLVSRLVKMYCPAEQNLLLPPKRIVSLTLVSACHPSGSPAGTRGICCGAAQWRPAADGWACGLAVAVFLGPLLCSASAWVECQVGSWCSPPTESEEVCGQNAFVGVMGAGNDARSPRLGRVQWPSCLQSVDQHIKGGAGPGGCGTCAGCTWTGLWGFGRAGNRAMDWPLTGTLEYFLFPIQMWATGWTSPASPGSLFEVEKINCKNVIRKCRFSCFLSCDTQTTICPDFEISVGELKSYTGKTCSIGSLDFLVYKYIAHRKKA